MCLPEEIASILDRSETFVEAVLPNLPFYILIIETVLLVHPDNLIYPRVFVPLTLTIRTFDSMKYLGHDACCCIAVCP